MLKIFYLPCASFLPFLFIFLTTSCATQSFEDDTLSRRNNFREDEASDALPNPRQAAAEAKKFANEADGRDTGQSRKGDDLGLPGGELEGISDMKAAYARIMVPEAMPMNSNFAPVRGGAVARANRRKPIFLGKLSFEATERRLEGVPTAIRAGKRTWTMALAAKSKPEHQDRDMGSYVVRPGDSLSTISMAIYGVAGRWMELAHLNRLGDGSVIFPKEIIFYVPERAQK